MFHSLVASALTVEPLGNNNYFMWSARMEWLLISKNQWAAVISDDAPELECRQARATIGLYVTGPHMATVKRSKTAKEAWTTLESLFKSKGTALTIRLRRELSTFKMAPSESLIKYFCRAKALHDQLQEANPAFKEEDLFWQTIQGLPSIYDTIITIIENDPALELTLDYILPKLVPVDQRHRGDRPDRTTEPALMAKPSFPNHRFSSGNQGPPMRRTDGRRPSFPSNDRRPSFPSSQERRPSFTSSNERRPSFPSTDRRQEEQDRGDGSCLYCHKPGHWTSECRKKKQDKKARRNNRGAPTPPRHNQFSAIAFTASYYPEAGVGLLPPPPPSPTHSPSPPSPPRRSQPLAAPCALQYLYSTCLYSEKETQGPARLRPGKKGGREGRSRC